MIRNLIVIVIALTLFAMPANAARTKEITVRGKLQKTVEAGGWLIVTEKQKYLILNSQKFKNEKWFTEGAEVEAAGITKKVMTIYMQGTPFEVRTMRPFEKRVRHRRHRKALTRVALKPIS